MLEFTQYSAREGFLEHVQELPTFPERGIQQQLPSLSVVYLDSLLVPKRNAIDLVSFRNPGRLFLPEGRGHRGQPRSHFLTSN